MRGVCDEAQVKLNSWIPSLMFIADSFCSVARCMAEYYETGYS